MRPQRVMRSASHDPVEEWKNLARQRATRNLDDPLHSTLGITTAFVVLSSVAGLRWMALGPVFALLAVTCVLLVHELPRAFLGRRLGRATRTTLSVFGADTALSGAPLSVIAEVGMSLACSGASALAALAGYAALHTRVTDLPVLLLHELTTAHAAYAILRLLPTSAAPMGVVFTRGSSTHARALHAAASLAFFVGFGFEAFFKLKAPLLAVLAALSTAASLRTLVTQVERIHDRRAGILHMRERAERLLDGGDVAKASALAREALGIALSRDERSELWRVSAWIAIANRDPFAAHQSIGRLPTECIDVHLVAAYLACCNRVSEAVELLEQVRANGYRSEASTKLLIDLYFRSRHERAIAEIARSDERLLTAEDQQAIRKALSEGFH